MLEAEEGLGLGLGREGPLEAPVTMIVLGAIAIRSGCLDEVEGRCVVELELGEFGVAGEKSG